jgi:hypothetical protein
MKTNRFVYLLVFNTCYILLLSLVCAFQPKRAAVKWAIKATYYESCSCNAPCPCPFGLPMTNSYCKLNALLIVHKGSFNKINLKGVKLIISGSSGDWGSYHFSEETTNEQKFSMEQILNIVKPGRFDKILTSQYTRIDVEHNAERIRYSTSNIKVDMTMVKGSSDKPVVIKNLNGKLFQDYIPYFSHINLRSDPETDYEFVFEKKAGFTSTWNFNQNDFK